MLQRGLAFGRQRPPPPGGGRPAHRRIEAFSAAGAVGIHGSVSKRACAVHLIGRFRRTRRPKLGRLCGVGAIAARLYTSRSDTPINRHGHS